MMYTPPFSLELFIKQNLLEILTGVAVLNKCNLLRCSASHNAAAAVAAFRSEINDIIRRFYYVEIVLDNKDTAAAVAKAFKNGKQSFNISNMQSCRRLIENIQCSACIAPSKLIRKLDALRFAAGKRC